MNYMPPILPSNVPRSWRQLRGCVIVDLGIIVFVVAFLTVIHFLGRGLVTRIPVDAIVAGMVISGLAGAYVAVKIVVAYRRRQVRRSSRARQVPREPQREQPRTVVPRATTQPAQPAQYDVEDEPARLRREMGQ